MVSLILRPVLGVISRTGGRLAAVFAGRIPQISRMIGTLFGYSTYASMLISAQSTKVVARLLGRQVAQLSGRQKDRLIQAIQKQFPQAALRARSINADLQRWFSSLTNEKKWEAIFYLGSIGLAVDEVLEHLSTTESAVKREDGSDIPVMSKEEFDQKWAESVKPGLDDLREEMSGVAMEMLHDDIKDEAEEAAGQKPNIGHEVEVGSVCPSRVEDVSERELSDAVDHLEDLRDRVDALVAAFGSVYDAQRVLRAIHETKLSDIEVYSRFQKTGWSR